MAEVEIPDALVEKRKDLPIVWLLPFIALNEGPPLDSNVPGLRLNLEADALGSLFVDAPVIYSDFTIGSVQAYG
ncbi:MAG: hypothetical protein JKY89_08775 [Immundisolibacteraceae bacterium]|nr:hypothetical protein [Immundisolibacteraceae bacterium]